MPTYGRVTLKHLGPLGVLTACISAPLCAEPVRTAGEAAAQFDEAARDGPYAATREDAMKCAGYWLALKTVHELSGDVSFWQDLPVRLGPATADLGLRYWSALVNEATATREEREAISERISAHQQEAIQRVIDAEASGGIEGLFDTLGGCTPRQP